MVPVREAGVLAGDEPNPRGGSEAEGGVAGSSASDATGIGRPVLGAESSLAPDPANELFRADWTAKTDDELVEEFDKGSDLILEGVLRRCKAVATIRDRQPYGATWEPSAYAVLGGGAVSKRTLQGLAGFWDAAVDHVTNDTLPIEHIAPIAESKDLVQAVGRLRASERAGALEAAVDYFVEFAEPPSPAALAHKRGVERGERQNVERYTPDGIRAAYRSWPDRVTFRNSMPKGMEEFSRWLESLGT